MHANHAYTIINDDGPETPASLAPLIAADRDHDMHIDPAHTVAAQKPRHGTATRQCGKPGREAVYSKQSISAIIHGLDWRHSNANSTSHASAAFPSVGHPRIQCNMFLFSSNHFDAILAPEIEALGLLLTRKCSFLDAAADHPESVEHIKQ